MSGSGGHSVFNIYLDISGIGGQGGTDAFNTHFVGSGSGHAGQGGQLGRSEAGVGGQEQGRGFVHRSHARFPDTSTNPSDLRFPIRNPI